MGGSMSYLLGTPGPSGYGSASTAEEVTANVSLKLHTVIVTGATSGIGKETARVLAKRGAHVILAIRNTKVGERVKAEFLADIPAARVDVMQLELSSLSSVRIFAAQFQDLNLPLNTLINNAGIFSYNFELSVDGLDLVFATNHMGHFLLTSLLLDKMKTTARETGIEGRIVILTSDWRKFHPRGGIDFEMLKQKKRNAGISQYGQSKLANILHANELARRLHEEDANVTANSVHPGTLRTNIGRNGILGTLAQDAFYLVGSIRNKNLSQGAATSCFVAAHPSLKGVSGKFFDDCNVKPTYGYDNDLELAAKLWTFSEDFLA